MASSRRGFLKSLAAILPTAAVANVVKKQADGAEAPPRKPPEKVATVQRPSSLKADRNIQAASYEFFCDCPAERGTVLELVKFHPTTTGTQYAVVRPGNHSGQPVGILMEDVVHLDPASFLNFAGDQVAVGGKVTVVQDGWLTVGSFNKPVVAGDQIYYDNAGRFTTQPTGRPIGRAISSSDDDGYAKIKVTLYVNENAKLPCSP